MLYNYLFDSENTAKFGFLEKSVHFANFRYEEKYNQVRLAFVTDNAIYMCLVNHEEITNGTKNEIDSPVLSCYMSDRLIYLPKEDRQYIWYSVPVEKGDEILKSVEMENGGTEDE